MTEKAAWGYGCLLALVSGLSALAASFMATHSMGENVQAAVIQFEAQCYERSPYTSNDRVLTKGFIKDIDEAVCVELWLRIRRGVVPRSEIELPREPSRDSSELLVMKLSTEVGLVYGVLA